MKTVVQFKGGWLPAPPNRKSRKTKQVNAGGGGKASKSISKGVGRHMGDPKTPLSGKGGPLGFIAGDKG